jgi:hypothetical protein
MEAEAETADGTIVEIVPGRAPVSVLLEAIDAALRSGMPGLEVGVALPAGDERRGPLEQLTAAESRVTIPAPGSARAAAAIVFEMPASARPEPRTLPRIAAIARERGLANVVVPVPGRVASLARLGLRGKLRAITRGSGSATIRPADVGLRSKASRGRSDPPPIGDLASERAEHLRHRARSATMRARMDRNAHRLSRERLQTRHERARLRLAEQRVGETGTGEWIRWRSRNVARRAAALPGAAVSAASSVRVLVRRARRFAVDRRRTRKLESGPGAP